MQFERLARDALLACLETVPVIRDVDVRAKVAATVDARADLCARIATTAGPAVLVVEFTTNGQPRHVRQAANQLHRYCQSVPGAYGVVVAPYISPRSAQICAEEGIGHVDLCGNCRLSFGQVYIERVGRPNRYVDRRELRSLFAPKATRILRVLLADPGRAWRVAALAAEAKVSLGQTSNVKRRLADRERARATPEGLVLSEPQELLAEWSQEYSFRQNHVADYYSLRSLGDVEAGLAALCGARNVRYALTAFSAAARLAPAVRYQRVMAFVDGPLEEVAAGLALKPVASGANVSLLAPYDEGVFYGLREIDGIRIASPIQVYLDLMSLRGRGEEAAGALLEEVIRPTW